MARWEWVGTPGDALELSGRIVEIAGPELASVIGAMMQGGATVALHQIREMAARITERAQVAAAEEAQAQGTVLMPDELEALFASVREVTPPDVVAAAIRLLGSPAWRDLVRWALARCAVDGTRVDLDQPMPGVTIREIHRGLYTAMRAQAVPL